MLKYFIAKIVSFKNNGYHKSRYFPNPSAMGRMQYKIIFFRWSTAGLNLVFLLQINCLTKAQEPSLLYNLPIAEERRDKFMSFPMALA